MKAKILATFRQPYPKSKRFYFWKLARLKRPRFINGFKKHYYRYGFGHIDKDFLGKRERAYYYRRPRYGSLEPGEIPF